MSTDFFDGLVKTFSKTTRELGARAEQTIETQKIRNKIAGEERIIEKDDYSTVTLFARFRGLSTSKPLATLM